MSKAIYAYGVLALAAIEAWSILDERKVSRPATVVATISGNPIAQKAEPVVGIFIPTDNGDSCLLDNGGRFRILQHGADAVWGWYQPPEFAAGVSAASCTAGYYSVRHEERAFHTRVA